MTKRTVWALFIAKGVISFTLISYLFQHVGISSLGSLFRALSFLSITASCVLLTVYFAMNSVRWVLILQALGSKLAMRDVLQIALITQFFSQFLPSSLGADLLRMWQSNKAGLTATVSINGVLLERITYLTGLSIVVGIIFPCFFEMRFPMMYSQSFIVLAVLAVSATGLLTVMDRVQTTWLPRNIAKYVCRLSADSRSIYLSPIRLFFGLVALFAGQVAFSATLMVLGPKFGININSVVYLAIGPVVVLLGAIPVSIAGWGVRELAMVELLTHLGADAQQALQLSLAVGLLSLVASMPGALLWIANTRVTTRQS